MSDLTVLFDGSCALCRASAQRVRRFDSLRRIELLDLRDPTAAQRFPQINREEAMKWMQAVDSRGRIHGGADAWARIGLLLPGWNLIVWILLLPGIRWLGAKVYAWIARNRYRWKSRRLRRWILSRPLEVSQIKLSLRAESTLSFTRYHLRR